MLKHEKAFRELEKSLRAQGAKHSEAIDKLSLVVKTADIEVQTKNNIIKQHEQRIRDLYNADKLFGSVFVLALVSLVGNVILSLML